MTKDALTNFHEAISEIENASTGVSAITDMASLAFKLGRDNTDVIVGLKQVKKQLDHALQKLNDTYFDVDELFLTANLDDGSAIRIGKTSISVQNESAE